MRFIASKNNIEHFNIEHFGETRLFASLWDDMGDLLATRMIQFQKLSNGIKDDVHLKLEIHKPYLDGNLDFMII